jgi:hypothetical protein
VTEEKEGQPGIARLGDLHKAGDITDVLGHVLDVKPLSFRFSAAAHIDRKDRKASLRKLFGRPGVLTAV